MRPAAAHFGIARKNVQDWLHERVKKAKGRGRKKQNGHGRKLTYPKEIDDEILQWSLEKSDFQLVV